MCNSPDRSKSSGHDGARVWPGATPPETSADRPLPDLSVVLPVYNEAGCIEDVLTNLAAHLQSLPPSEILAVDDGSTDDTPRILSACRARCPTLRVLRLRPHAGQSAAMAAGFRHARGRWIITLDADGQMDPADMARVLEVLQGGADCVLGYREDRKDSWSKTLGSRLANAVRNAVLRESVRDTGCPFKGFRADLVRNLPVWNGIHRFLPSFLLMQGAQLVQIPVRHRRRLAGRSKYTNWGRLRRTAADLLGVWWWKRRAVRFTVIEETV